MAEINEFEGRRKIAIAGCTRGIGRAMVHEFHRLGHAVAGCGRSEDAIEELRIEPGAADAFRGADVLDEGSIEAWREAIIEHFGQPDTLIINAGAINEPAPFHKIPASDFAHVIQVNVLGVANVLRCFLPGFLETGRGMLIAISSGCGHHGYPDVSPYCASKHAVEGLMKSLAAELSPPLASIPLSPGVINTDMLQQYMGESIAARHEGPTDWAKHACPYILGLRASQNGQSLRVPQ